MKKFLNILGCFSLSFLVLFLFFMFIAFFNLTTKILGVIGICIFTLFLIFYYKKRKTECYGIFMLIFVLLITIYCLALNFVYRAIKNVEINNLVNQIDYIEYYDTR